MLEGRLFSREGLANATDWMEIRPDDPANRGEYGLGLFRSRYDGFSAVGHTGSLPGGGAIMQYITELDVYMGAVMNTDLDADGASGLLVRIRRALLNDS